MSSANLTFYKKELYNVFKKNDYPDAHVITKPILIEMSKNEGLIHEIIRENLSKPGYFDYPYWGPIMGFDIEFNHHFSLALNCFLPARVTENISSQSIHHHGNLKLTVVGAYGDGYESIIFKRNYFTDSQTGITDLQPNIEFKNSIGHISFVDAFVPHVVFFPKSLNLSYALFSPEKKRLLYRLKNIEILKKNKERIKNILTKFRVIKQFGLQDPNRNFDFYPENGRIKHLANRVNYESGPKEAAVQNLFYVLQTIGFNDHSFWLERKKTLTDIELKLTEKWADMWLKNVPIDCFPDAVNINNPLVNFSKEYLYTCINNEGK